MKSLPQSAAASPGLRIARALSVLVAVVVLVAFVVLEQRRAGFPEAPVALETPAAAEAISADVVEAIDLFTTDASPPAAYLSSSKSIVMFALPVPRHDAPAPVTPPWPLDPAETPLQQVIRFKNWSELMDMEPPGSSYLSSSKSAVIEFPLPERSRKRARKP